MQAYIQKQRIQQPEHVHQNRGDQTKKYGDAQRVQRAFVLKKACKIAQTNKIRRCKSVPVGQTNAHTTEKGDDEKNGEQEDRRPDH